MKNTFFLILLFVVAGAVQAGPAPDWFLQHIAEMTANGGVWQTSNAKYQSESETFDHYGLEWQQGIHAATMTGRLFGLKEGQRSKDFWHFRVYWDAAANVGIIQQFAPSGVVGTGTLVGFGEGTMTEQTFVNPNGTSRKDRHHAWTDATGHTTVSYGYEDGAWTERRRYIWQQNSVP